LSNCKKGARGSPGSKIALHKPMTRHVKISRLHAMNLSFFGFFLAAASGLGACASAPQYTQLPKDTDPSQEISMVSQQFEHAKSNQVDVYAPDSFAKAESAFNDARKDRSFGKSNDVILNNLAKSKAWLSQAEGRSSQTQSSLGEVVSARTRAVDAGAQTYPSSKELFKKADDQVYHFAKSADGASGPGHVSDQDRVQWLAQFQEAQLHAAQQKDLGHAQALIDQSRSEGAEKLAPQSLAAAQAKYSQAVGVIRHNPNDSGAIQIAGQEADQAAERLLQVTRLAKGNQNKHPEAIAEAALNEKQASEQLTEQNAALAIQKNAMMDETKLTETVKQVQSKFTPDEAQVFEDGKQVHIRLKALTFPTGSATIQPADYALMGKVGDVIKESRPSEVRIDGRTDSRGKKATNQKLSEKRADAVKEFLVAGKAVDPAKITSEGFGSSKPVASEKTADGRKLNRSIDVLLVPSGAISQSAPKGRSASKSAGQAGIAAPNTSANTEFNSIAK
jgi:OOP family OmpA-OmpF porin